ncbi:hypothetical protein LP52_13865 [Streptomonospora alba]|uniref:Secreted protein n=1 Tax=Streptomonospora alba TaxID=183763 RepID=A0A0C2J9W3_9ACTN|nr:hypothetical protein [Streptomonospora alba]KIH98261.1 hypothetical protein LP52_13865 [Streptomonospora alba]
MRLFSAALSATALAGALVMATSGTAQAATGDVVVFKTELERLDTYENPPDGACYSLPGTAHVLLNQTDSVVTIHSEPGCMFPGVPVQPDHGWHAPASGLTGPFSFSIG